MVAWCMPLCVCVRVCVRTCVRECVHAYMRVRLCLPVSVYIGLFSMVLSMSSLSIISRKKWQNVRFQDRNNS